MAGLRPPEKDIGPARAPSWAGFAVLCVFGALLLAFALLERLGLQSGRMSQGVCAAALAAFAITAILSHARRLEDFYLADRDIRPLPAGVAGAAGFAGILTIGLAAGVFQAGSDAAGAAVGLLAGFAVAACLIAPRLRRSGGSTLGDVFHVRFGLTARLAIAAAGALASFLLLLALLTTGGALVAAFTGLTPRDGLAVATAVIVLATLPGGLRSLRATQTVQFAVIVAGCLLAGALLMTQSGDAAAIAPLAGSAGIEAVAEALADLFAPDSIAATLPPLVLMALGAAALPQVLVAASSARTPGVAVASLLWTLVLSLALLVGAIALGAVLTDPSDPIAGLIGDDLFMASGPLFAALPPLPAGLLMAGAFAALLAAAQAALLAAAGALSHDFGDELLDRDGPPGRRIFAARLAVAIVASVAAWLSSAAAIDPAELLGWALALAAAGIFVPLVLGLWWRGATPDGIVLGTLAGLGVAAFMFLIDLGSASPLLRAAGMRPIGSTEAAAFGVAIALAATIGGSLATRGGALARPVQPSPRLQARGRRSPRPAGGLRSPPI